MQDYVLLNELQTLIGENSSRIGKNLKSIQRCQKVPYFIATRTGSNQENVTISVNENRTRAKFSNLFGCQNSWICPVCAPRKANLLAKKTNEFLKRKNAEGYKAIMFTMTVPHYFYEKPKAVLTRLNEAWRFSMHNHVWYRIKKDCGIIGFLRVTECTFSKKCGFHFHFHGLLIGDDRIENILKYEELLDTRVKTAALANMTRTSVRPGSNIYENENKGFFISKCDDGALRYCKETSYLYEDWSPAQEMTNLFVKNVGPYSMHMFDLLKTDNPYHYQKFLEYAEATADVPRIRVTPKIGWTDITKEELEEEEREEYAKKKFIPIAMFLLSDWFRIINYENENRLPIRVMILQAALDEGFEGIEKLMERYRLPLPRPPEDEEEILTLTGRAPA